MEINIKEIVIGTIIGIILGLIFEPSFDNLLVNLGIIETPKLEVKIHEFKLDSENGLIKDKEMRDELGDIFWKNHYLFYVIDIKNKENSKESINNILSNFNVNGSIFKIIFNSINEEKCIISRPNKVRLHYGLGFKDINPFDDTTIKNTTNITGTNTLIISCNELAPGDIISIHVFVDSRGICDKRCEKNLVRGRARTLAG